MITDRWQHGHCSLTIGTFERLNEKKQHELLDYLGKLSIAICDLEVHEELLYLTHGGARPQFAHGIVAQQDVKNGDVIMEHFVWDRMDVYERLLDDRSVIVGHAPTPFLQEARPYAIWTDTGDVKTTRIMNIDCGCVTDDIYSRLGVVCLGTRAVQCF